MSSRRSPGRGSRTHTAKNSVVRRRRWRATSSRLSRDSSLPATGGTRPRTSVVPRLRMRTRLRLTSSPKIPAEMPNVTPTELTDRQRSLLRGLVEEHIATGQPVGSRTLVERTGLRVSSSTVRAELAELEALGLLTHPHTSARRVPTEAAYRYYADGLLEGA